MAKRNIIAISILAVILTTLAFLQTPLMANVRSAAWHTLTMVTARTFKVGPIEDADSLTGQLQELQLENARLRAELQDYNRLRDQLGSPSFDSMKAIPAVTIGRPLDAFRSQYVINKGFRDGVAIDAPVVMRGSLLIGFIVETSERTSVMQTLLHPTTHLTVETVENNDEETALARGLLRSKHYTSLILTTVPRDMSLSAGQHLVTVGKETVIPYGLVVGKVTSVINREHEAYQEANLELLYNPDSIDAVHVLVSS